MADANTTPDDELDALYNNVMTCDPAIAPEDVEPLANLVMQQERVGRQWRLTAVLAGKDGQFFREVAEDEETAMAVAPCIDPLHDFAKLMRAMADLAECSATRLTVAGCNHQKFNEWMNQDLS